MIGQPYIVCPKCGMVSHNPNDVRERYCGNCHAFHEDFARTMSDDELIEPRRIKFCKDAGDGSWEVLLSCGHQIVVVVQPVVMERTGCAQCLDIFLERRKK